MCYDAGGEGKAEKYDAKKSHGAKVQQNLHICKYECKKNSHPLRDDCRKLHVVDLLGAEMPYILTESVVLVLVLEVELVLWLLGWVFQSFCHSRSHLSPIGTVLLLIVADRSGTLTISGGVIEFGCSSVCKANLMVFADTSVDLVHREGIFYFSHSVRHWLALQAVVSLREVVCALRR